MKPILLFLTAITALAQNAAFPGTISSSQNLKVSVNGVATLLTQNIGANDSVFSVSSCGPGIVPYVLITVDTEIMNVTGCSGTVMVVAGRGFDSTVAVPHLAQTPIYAFVDAWHHNVLAIEIEAIESALGVNLANVAMTGSSPTFAGITITGALNTASITDTGTLSVGGTSTLGAVSVSGALSVTGNFSATGSVSGAHLQNLGVTDSPTFNAISAASLTTTPVTGFVVSPIFNADVVGYTGNTFQNSDGSWFATYQGTLNAQQGHFTNTFFSGGYAVTATCGQTSPLLACGAAISMINNQPRSLSVVGYAASGLTNGNNSLLFGDNGGMCIVGTGVGGAQCSLAGTPVGPSISPLRNQLFSALPPCSAAYFGSTAAVADSTTNTWGTTITGSGGFPVLAFCNGVNWSVAAH